MSVAIYVLLAIYAIVFLICWFGPIFADSLHHKHTGGGPQPPQAPGPPANALYEIDIRPPTN